mgnify:CR=1 FL=1
MDDPTSIAVVVAIVTGIFSAGGFKFYEFVLKQRREAAKDDQANKDLYRDDLINRVEQIMQLMTSVSALKVEVDYMRRDSEILRLKIDAARR